jgi:hypothetical protein
VSRTFGSLSGSSTDTHANAWPLRAAHCDSSVVFPYPAGATTETIGRGSPRASRSISNLRRTVPGRTSGRRSFDTTRSNAGPPALAAKIAIGAVLLVIAIRHIRARGRPRRPKKPPKWQQHVDSMSPWFALGLARRCSPGR